MSCRLISRGKKHANKFLGEKYPALKKISLITYNAEKKKNLTPLYVGEKISNSRDVWEKILPIQTKSVKSPIPHSPTNVQWSCQPFKSFRGWGKKGRHLFPSAKLTWRHLISGEHLRFTRRLLIVKTNMAATVWSRLIYACQYTTQTSEWSEIMFARIYLTDLPCVVWLKGKS